MPSAASSHQAPLRVVVSSSTLRCAWTERALGRTIAPLHEPPRRARPLCAWCVKRVDIELRPVEGVRSRDGEEGAVARPQQLTTPSEGDGPARHLVEGKTTKYSGPRCRLTRGAAARLTSEPAALWLSPAWLAEGQWAHGRMETALRRSRQRQYSVLRSALPPGVAIGAFGAPTP